MAAETLSERLERYFDTVLGRVTTLIENNLHKTAVTILVLVGLIVLFLFQPVIDQETRRLALQTFRDILTAPDAKAADRLRAAEGVMKLEQEERDQGMGDVLDASDAELLEKARGGRPASSNGSEGPANGPPEDDNPAQ